MWRSFLVKLLLHGAYRHRESIRYCIRPAQPSRHWTIKCIHGNSASEFGVWQKGAVLGACWDSDDVKQVLAGELPLTDESLGKVLVEGSVTVRTDNNRSPQEVLDRLFGGETDAMRWHRPRTIHIPKTLQGRLQLHQMEIRRRKRQRIPGSGQK